MKKPKSSGNEYGVTRPEPISGRVISLNMGEELSACFNDAPPPCRAVCPFGLDVVSLTDRVAAKRFPSAYRALSEQLLFPEIVRELCERPCENICLRSGIDGPIRINAIEKAAIEFGSAEPQQRYKITKQGKSVAVVGGGLSGVSAAASLGSVGYDVTIFEKQGGLGGRLSAVMSPEIYLPAISARLGPVECNVVIGHEINDIDELDSFDAVVVSTGGADGTDGLPEAADIDGAHVFRCGIGDGEAAVTAIVRAMGLATQVQSWLKTGVLPSSSPPSPASSDSPDSPAQPQIDDSRLAVLKNSYMGTPPAERVSDMPFGRENAASEASLCLACKCELCKEACDFMRFYNMTPKTIRNNVRMNLNPMEGMKAHVATRMIFSCNACGVCKEACPEDIDTGDLILLARSLMQRANEVPPVFHEFWLRDMAHADSGSASLLRHAPGRSRSKYLFFPGCQLGAAEPELIGRAYGKLVSTESDTGLFLGCCGAPAMWSGRENRLNESLVHTEKVWEEYGRPVFILACPSCMRVFKSHLPQIETVSLYEYFSDNVEIAEVVEDAEIAGIAECAECARQDSKAMDGTGVTYAVFDPCAAHPDDGAGKGVRALLVASGNEFRELPKIKGGSGCCGFGGLPYPANPDLATKTGAHRVMASELPYVTYCVNCRDIFRKNGKACRHVLEIALPGEYGDSLAAPSLSQRRDNRETLKQRLLADLWKEDTEMEHDNLPEIKYTDGLRDKMDALLLLESDVAAVIKKGESEGCQLVDPETGDYTVHGRVGLITCWATYRPEGSGFFVENVYCHRMNLAGE